MTHLFRKGNFIALILSLIGLSLACGISTPRNQANNPISDQSPANESEELNQVQPTNTVEILPTPTIHGVVNPSGTIEAGMPVIVDNVIMVIDPSDMLIEGNFVGFTIRLRTVGENQKLFRYNSFALSLSDDLGNQYPFMINTGNTHHCDESDIYNAKQIMIEPEKEIVISSDTGIMYSSYPWCIDGDNDNIPGFAASIPGGARSLFLHFEAFGPFSGFSYQFDI